MSSPRSKPPASPSGPAATPGAQGSPKPQPGKAPWLWNVVLLDDAEHTFEYVIRMMQTLFGHTPEAARLLAETVDREGRAVCMTTHKELAELKREQILAFGKDPTAPKCSGSMGAVIEPV